MRDVPANTTVEHRQKVIDVAAMAVVKITEEHEHDNQVQKVIDDYNMMIALQVFFQECLVGRYEVANQQQIKRRRLITKKANNTTDQTGISPWKGSPTHWYGPKLARPLIPIGALAATAPRTQGYLTGANFLSDGHGVGFGDDLTIGSNGLMVPGILMLLAIHQAKKYLGLESENKTLEILTPTGDITEAERAVLDFLGIPRRVEPKQQGVLIGIPSGYTVRPEDYYDRPQERLSEVYQDWITLPLSRQERELGWRHFLNRRTSYVEQLMPRPEQTAKWWREKKRGFLKIQGHIPEEILPFMRLLFMAPVSQEDDDIRSKAAQFRLAWAIGSQIETDAAEADGWESQAAKDIALAWRLRNNLEEVSSTLDIPLVRLQDIAVNLARHPTTATIARSNLTSLLDGPTARKAWILHADGSFTEQTDDHDLTLPEAGWLDGASQ